jgi:hypothetical protein
MRLGTASRVPHIKNYNRAASGSVIFQACKGADRNKHPPQAIHSAAWPLCILLEATILPDARRPPT